MIEQFHFLRPAWLLALPLLGALLWWLRQRGVDSANWRSVVDPRLLPYVVSGVGGRRHGSLFWLLAIVAVLAIIALAGPTWEQRQQLLYRQPAALVVALDLSRSMDATDVRPSRLTRARHKIADILRARKEGQSALVVYAGDAFAVTPLTTDVETILALLPELETGLMPVQGTRADRALERALELFDNSAVRHGDLLLVSDGISDVEFERLQALLDRHPGHRVSVLAIGTVEGGPIPLRNGGFLKNQAGEIVIAAMDMDNMLEIASRAGGVYTGISASDIDVNTLTYVLESSPDDEQARLSEDSAELWRELGPGLLLLLLPFAALAFRRGLIWTLPLMILVLPPDAQALDWQSLWQNQDQRALRLFQQGEHEAAAKLFADERWQASAQYRSGDYAGAAAGWQQYDDDDARYNHATALARQGQYEEALAAYDRLLQRSPDHADARHNREAIEDWLQQQPQQPQQGQSAEQQDDSGESQQQDAESQAGDGQQSDSAGDASEPAGQADSNDSDPADTRPQDMSEQGQQAQQPSQQNPESGEREDDADAQSLANLEEQMSEQAAQQWLRKIPDDPGGLLRRKFIYQYRNRGGVDTEAQAW